MKIIFRVCMNQVTPQNTVLKISRLGFGCGSFWARKHFDTNKAISLVHQAYESGVNYFDTGPSYGAGLGELRLGEAMRKIPRSKIIVSTKVGTHVTDSGKIFHDFSPGIVKESLNASLKRLGTDYVDILYLHGPLIPNINTELVDALAECGTSGKVRYFGINSFSNEVINHALDFELFRAYMFEYNLIQQQNESVIELVNSRGNFSIAATPVGRALFNWKTIIPTDLSRIWYALRTLRYQRRNFVRSRRFSFLNDLGDITGAQAALAFTLSHPKLTGAVFGTTRVKHLEENIAAEGLDIPEWVIKKIQENRGF